MRSFLIAIAVLGICGCGIGPRFDLRHPVYMVTEKSFWSGCDKDPIGSDACRNSRISQVKAGVNQWFDPFDEAFRPQLFIFYSKDKLPRNRDRTNEVIYLKIESGNCGYIAGGKRKAGACYGRDHLLSKLYIVFEDASNILPQAMAHEFGHALGRDDNDVPKGTGSVMSYDTPTNVLLMDIEMMCRLHRECPPRK
jgi:hypothetical protein